MAALTLTPGAAVRRRSPSASAFRFGFAPRTIILVLTGLYFLIPLAASARYALEGSGGSISFSSIDQLFHDGTLWSGLVTSLEIAAGAAVITLLLLVPTSIWINLRMPAFRRTMEGLTLLPLVVPTVVLVLGIFGAFRSFPNLIVGTPVILALEYVVLALPFSYRAIDSGVQALDLHTLVDAGKSLGSGWTQLFWRVLLPNLRTAILSAAFLTVAYSIGEFAVANLLTFNTFPTRLYEVGTEYAGEATAVSVFALVLTWGLLLVMSFVGGRKRRQHAATAALPATTELAGSVSEDLAAEVDELAGAVGLGGAGAASAPAPHDEEQGMTDDPAPDDEEN